MAQLTFDKSGSKLLSVVGSRVSLKRRGREYLGLCPFHDDHNPSFYVVPDKGFANCFSCGWNGDAVDFVRDHDGISFQEACEAVSQGDWKPITIRQELAARASPRIPWTSQPPPSGSERPQSFHLNYLGEPSFIWTYLSPEGTPIGYCARYHLGDAPNVRKEIRYWTYGADANRQLRWACRHFSKPRPLYGLHELERRKKSQVIVVEGEKTAEATQALFPSSVAVTWPGGSKATANVDWEPLYGRRVVVIPDASEEGRAAARRICALLSTRGCSLRYVNPEGDRPNDWDLADARDDGWLASEALDWARKNIHAYLPDEPNPIPSPIVQIPNPAKQTTEASDISSPIAPAFQRPTLVSLDGETLPPFPPDDSERDLSAPEFSDSALAAYFVKKYGEDWRYCKEEKQWHYWNGKAWRADKTDCVYSVAETACKEVATFGQGALLTDGAKRRLTAASTFKSIIFVASCNRAIAVPKEVWDKDIWLLSTPDGVVYLKTGELRPARREDYSKRMTLVGPGGDCPTWKAFLKRVTAENQELEDYLQRLAGYCLTGSIEEHCFAFLFGTGANGKGCFIRTIEEIMGEYAVNLNTDAFVESRGDRHPTEIAKLHKMRLATAQETDQGKRWAESKIKGMTGGDSIAARYIAKDEFEFKPEFKLIFSGNNKPGLRNVDDAIRRRIHVVPFTVTIPEDEMDKKLEQEKLPKEFPGILQWMIDGCLAWQKTGLRPPACVKDVTNDYLEMEDALLGWLEECCEIQPGKSEIVGRIWKSYLDFCTRNSDQPWSRKRLILDLQKRGVTNIKVGGVRMLEGIRLLQAEHERMQSSGGTPLYD